MPKTNPKGFCIILVSFSATPKSVSIFVINIKGKSEGKTAVANKTSPSKNDLEQISGNTTKTTKKKSKLIAAQNFKTALKLNFVRHFFSGVLKLFMVNNMKEEQSVKPKIGIARGSGASRGFAHIGFLRAIEEAGIKIDVIAGSSMGAIVGGMYAAGVPILEIEKLARGIKRSQIVDFSPRPSKGGFVKGDKAEHILAELLAEHKLQNSFAKTKIKFGCMATDLVSGKAVALTKGNLTKSIHASFSMAGIFRPVEINNMVLTDGGPLSRVPVDLCRKLGADIVIGVDCAGPTIKLKKEDVSNYTDVLARFLLLSEYEIGKAEIESADIVVSIQSAHINPINIKEGLANIEVGYREGKKAVQKLKELLKKPLV